MAAPELQSLGNNASPSTSLAAFMSNAKRLYDLGIALPVLLYSCGFVVLGCYSVEHDLGLQAFPTIQFFSSGAAFLLIFAAVMAVIIGIRVLLAKYFTWLNRETAVGRLMKKMAIWIMLGSVAASVILGKLHMDRLSNAAMFMALFSLLFFGDGWAQHMTRYYLYFNGLILGLALLGWYAFVAYPAIPASFGGGKPRRAHVALDMKSLPPGLASQLAKHDANASGEVAGFDAEIYLITDSQVLMKVPRAPAPGGAPQNGSPPNGSPAIILELRRSDVSAIFWDSRH
jgi:hypothetical protein